MKQVKKIAQISTLEIAETGEMKLHLCDYHLEAGRLCSAEGKKTEAAEHVHIAAELIEKTGYYRRKKELSLLFENK
ncbi:MAG: hypothetical protein QG657_588 [Acidobacteriota bacterium]|nr:hypothetical protein [Acidobacteriota bacterium]